MIEPSPEVRRGRPPRPRTAEGSQTTRQEKRIPEPLPNEHFGPLNRQAKSRSSFLSHFIEARFDLQRLSAEIRKRLKNKGTSVPEHRKYSLVGTAIDYRLRAYFTNRPYEGTAVSNGLKIIGSTACKNHQNALRKFFIKLRPARKLLGDREERRLCAYCVAIAQLETIYRVGLWGAEEYFEKFRKLKFEKIANTVDPAIVADLVHLSKTFGVSQNNLIKDFQRAKMGLTLQGSRDVIGADFDLLIDNCLFDFKTTIKPRDIRASLRQLIGYWLLDYDDEFRIGSVALCFTRQNYTHSFEIRELLPKEQTFESLRKAFRQGIQAHNARSTTHL